jgi:hypothetical protein
MEQITLEMQFADFSLLRYQAFIMPGHRVR